MMSKRIILTILIAVSFLMSGNAQEYLTGFNGGIPEQESLKLRDEITATLPFFDDFTDEGIYPDASRWQTGNVSVSSGFPKMPVNYRAATLDVLDRYGKVYSRGSSNPFLADSLLSVKIRLDSLNGHALTPADSLYFSFYYQPGGFGDSPERDDSLVLQFGYGYDEVVFDTVLQNYVTLRKTAWKQMWASEGMEFETFVDSLGENQYFKKVMIPITDTCFFKEDFQILFFNYGTLPTQMYPNDRSNMDQWNIDFVYLDVNRSLDNDNYPAVNFTHNSPIFLKRYRTMPYKHYKENPINEINNIFDMYLTNMDVNAHEVRYSCDVEDNNSDWSYSYSSNPFIINQYSNVGVMRDSVVMGDFIYPYNLPGDTASFTIRYTIEVVDEHSGEVAGDVLEHQQVFGNYFSYDDGTPESGYGLVPNNTYFAVQFKVTTLDTLRGVQMLFNRTFNDANFNFFDIVVWRDNNGKPGAEMYSLKNQRPIWNDSVMYAFSEYTFDKIVKVNSVFYVGIRQQYSKSINIGFDSSIDSRQYNFYDVGEGWQNSSFIGSIMLRPIMGGNPDLIVNTGDSDNGKIVLYPNPANDVVRISGNDQMVYREIVIFDLAGRVVKQAFNCNEMNVNDLQDGVYLLRVVKENGAHETTKLLISK